MYTYKHIFFVERAASAARRSPRVYSSMEGVIHVFTRQGGYRQRVFFASVLSSPLCFYVGMALGVCMSNAEWLFDSSHKSVLFLSRWCCHCSTILRASTPRPRTIFHRGMKRKVCARDRHVCSTGDIVASAVWNAVDSTPLTLGDIVPYALY